MQGFGGGGGP